MHPIKKIKSIIKGFTTTIISFPIILGILLPTLFVTVLLDWISEITQAQRHPEMINEMLEIENLNELVEIKESPDGSGYYLDFVDGIDEKLEQIIIKSNKDISAGVHTLPKDTQFLKKIFQAELVTQYPDLGGNIPEDSTGFQGATTLRRVTPNKKMGDINDNPGRGETTKQEEDVVYEPSDDTKEGVVKSWSSGQQLTILGTATVYEQEESKLKPGKDTGKWNKKHKVTDDGVTLLNEYETIKQGTTVSYTGTYKRAENPLTKEVVIYVEIEHKEEKKFVRAENVKANELENKEEKEEKEEKESKKVSSRADNDKATEYAGKDKDEEYVIAIAAGHNNSNDTGARSSDGSLIEEQLTIRTAEKVEQLLKKYKNIKVVQVGSTSSNPSGISVGDRTRLARDAKPNLCIQIHYDAGGGSGVQAIYKAGDGISQQLAEFVSDEMASSMGLPNKGAGSDLERTAIGSLGIIENAATSGFPSIVTEGGFLDGEPDATLLKGDGTDKCAQGIVKGILEYLKADHSGYTSTVIDDSKTQTLIESKVMNLKYVPEEKFEELIKSANQEALKSYTIDKDGKIIIATWNLGADGKLQIKKNSSKIDLKISLKSYIMPYEYLLYFYMDINERAFPEKLAETVLDTEIIMAIQDNITTTQTITATSQLTQSDDGVYSSGWSQKGTTTQTTENCTTRIEVTYADAWCVKYEKENNTFSDKELNWKEGETEKIVNIKGKIDQTESTSVAENVVDSGTITDVDDRGNKIRYNYKTYQQTTTTTKRLNINYENGTGEVKENATKFVNIFKDTKAYTYLRDYYLFSILEGNEKTANMVDLTKYLLWKASGIGYGVYEYEFSEYDMKGFAGALGGIYGGTIQEKVWVAVINAGYSKEAAAGVLGNIEAESGFNAGIIEGGTGIGIGLCQWSFDRRTALEQYAASKGKEWADENIQIQFLIGEMTPGGGADGFATYVLTSYGGYSLNDWENASTPEDAAVAFCWIFEKPGIPRMEERTAAARKYYDMFKDRDLSSFKGGGSSDDIIQTARAVLQDMIDRDITYGPQTYNDIEKTATSDTQYVCATYVAVVLYRSGALTAEQINAYNYHFTGADGFPDMLPAAGWVQVDPSEAQPGDVVNAYGHHVMIYAGGNGVYDEACAQQNHTIEPSGNWNYYANWPGIQVFRRP